MGWVPLHLPYYALSAAVEWLAGAAILAAATQHLELAEAVGMVKAGAGAPWPSAAWLWCLSAPFSSMHPALLDCMPPSASPRPLLCSVQC